MRRTLGATGVIVGLMLVSDPYYLLRAKLEFEKEGLQVQTSPVLLAPRHRSLLSRAWWTCREVAALARFELR